MSQKSTNENERREPQNEAFAKSVSIAKKIKPKEFAEKEIREEHQDMVDKVPGEES